VAAQQQAAVGTVFHDRMLTAHLLVVDPKGVPLGPANRHSPFYVYFVAGGVVTTAQQQRR
jgi:hypothetical protein